MLILKKHPHI